MRPRAGRRCCSRRTCRLRCAVGAAVFQTRRLESPHHVGAAAYQTAFLRCLCPNRSLNLGSVTPPPCISCLLLVLLHTSSTTGVGDSLTSPPTADAHTSSTGPGESTRFRFHSERKEEHWRRLLGFTGVPESPPSSSKIMDIRTSEQWRLSSHKPRTP